RLAPACIPGPPGQPPLHFPIGRTELYDLAHDPGETTNLAAARPLEVAALTRLIDQRFASLPRAGRRQQVPERVRKELRTLGYVAPERARPRARRRAPTSRQGTAARSTARAARGPPGESGVTSSGRIADVGMSELLRITERYRLDKLVHASDAASLFR